MVTMVTASASHAAVQVDASQPYGILITNGEFTAFCDAPSFAFCNGPGNNASPVHVRVGAGNKGAVKFSNSAFWGPLWCGVAWCGVVCRGVVWCVVYMVWCICGVVFAFAFLSSLLGRIYVTLTHARVSIDPCMCSGVGFWCLFLSRLPPTLSARLTRSSSSDCNHCWHRHGVFHPMPL